MTLAFMSLQCENRALFFLKNEKAILYNILLLVGGLRRWPNWPIASADIALKREGDIFLQK